jgi:hypothetical protein
VIQTLGISSLIGAGLFVPWFSRLTGGNMFRVFKMQISTPPDQMPAVTRQFNALGDLTFFLPAGIWAVLIAAIVWLLLRRVKGAGLFVIWCGILILIGNPAWLNLPGTGVVNNFTLLIAAYIPAGLFIGVAAESVWAALTGRLAVSRQRLGSFLGGLVLCALLLLGLSSVTDRIDDIQPGSYTLATRPDLRAMQWIQENTLPQSKFLVNSFLAFGDSVAVGADAGWWVPMLAGRKTTLPPINQGYEAGPSAGYRQEIIQLTRAVQTLGVTNSDVLELLYQQGVSHIFIGQQQGKVNNAGSVLDPAVLLSSPAFTPVYHQDRVWIFKILGTDD